MAVTITKLDEVMNEALRFVDVARKAKARLSKERFLQNVGCTETGAVRRASMDLSRMLVDLRK